MKSFNPSTHSMHVATLVAMGTLVLTSACSSNISKVSREQLLENQAPENVLAVQAPNFNIQLYDGNVRVYDELSNSGSLQMEDGKSYTLKVLTQATGISVSLSVDGAAPQQLQLGDNAIQFSGISNKAIKITASAPQYAPRIKSYNVGVTCTAAEMADFKVNASGISVSAAAENNLFNYSASGVASGGSGSYECAWDFNGDGIRDSAFGPCSEARSSIYSNHVGERQISVMVRDLACNRVLVAEASRNLGSYGKSVVLPQPQVYVHANVSSVISPADKRLNLKHLSSNMTGVPSHAQCYYARANGKGSYTIAGLNAYGQASHGLKLTFQDLLDNVNMVTRTGTIDSSGAKVQSVAFSTDQSPDSQSQLRFDGNFQHCTGTINAIPKNVVGNECAGGDAEGVEGSYTISAEGTFSCLSVPSSTAAGQKVNITEGSFFCEFALVDQCIGKGGSAGGTPPIQL